VSERTVPELSGRPDLVVGELVDVTVRRARVDGVDNAAYHLSDGGGHELVLPHDFTDVEIARVAPAQWPPQVADLWRDVSGRRWYAIRTREDLGNDGTNVGMVPTEYATATGLWTPDELLTSYGPLDLVFREGWTPPSAEPKQPAPYEVPEITRESVVAGLRELADLIESRPDMPLPANLRVGYSLHYAGPSAVRAAASLLGVDVEATRLDSDGNIHHNANRSFGPVQLNVYSIERIPKPNPTEAEPEQPDAGSARDDRPEAGR